MIWWDWQFKFRIQEFQIILFFVSEPNKLQVLTAKNWNEKPGKTESIEG
jgi:hypothetical protein